MPEISELNSEDNKSLNILNTLINSGSCVLLLGPLFGLDDKGEKIHVNMKKFLTDPPNNLLLDDEFDNLFISRKSDGSQNAEIIAGTTSFLQSTKRNEIYDKLLQIGFKAIITYTSDLFLYEANQEANGYDFFAFSKKGSDNGAQQDQEQGFSKSPVIYNIFGDIRDLNTLIIDYDSLYDFLLNIIKAEKEFPLQLRNILGQATAFLFLGFDLSRWYIPVIIRKLNQFILSNNSRRSVSGFACLDDTPMTPSREIQDSLSKYPLVFKAFEIHAVDLINRLHALPRNMHNERMERKDRPPTQFELNYFLEWQKDSSYRGAEESLQNFFRDYKDMKYEGIYKSDFSGLSMQYYQNMNDKSINIINTEDFRVNMARIIQSLSHVIDKFK